MSKKQKNKALRIGIAALGMVGLYLFPLSPVPHTAVSLCLYFIIGYDILRKALRGICRGRVFDENFLMALATIGAIVLAFIDKSYDFSKVANHLDIVAYNNYPVWGGQANPIPSYEIACGLDFMRGAKKQNFWITEAIMGAQGHNVIGYLPRPNQAKMW